MRHPVMLLAAVLGAAAAPASAVSISGTVTTENGSTGDLLPLGAFTPGKYRFSITLDRVVARLFLEKELSEVYNEYCDPDGSGTIVYCGGDDVPTLPSVEGFDTDRVSFVYQLRQGFTQPLPFGGYATTHFFDNGGRFEADTDLTGPIHDPATLTAVPEAATWAMMIAGFGLAGAVSRRARARGARPHPA